ncbi:MAG: hypothetical protein RI967_320 [Planctomycetota bacterium]
MAREDRLAAVGERLEGDGDATRSRVVVAVEDADDPRGRGDRRGAARQVDLDLDRGPLRDRPVELDARPAEADVVDMALAGTARARAVSTAHHHAAVHRFDRETVMPPPFASFCHRTLHAG